MKITLFIYLICLQIALINCSYEMATFENNLTLNSVKVSDNLDYIHAKVTNKQVQGLFNSGCVALKNQHKSFEQYLSKTVSEALKQRFVAKSFIIDDTNSSISLREDGMDIQVGFSKLEIQTHISDKFLIFNIDEDVSVSISDTYIKFFGTIDKTQKELTFSQFEGHFKPDFLQKMNVKFSGILANIAFDVAQSILSSWIQKTFIDNLVSKYKDQVNSQLKQVQENGLNFMFMGVGLKMLLTPIYPININSNYIDAYIDGTMSSSNKLVKSAMSIANSPRAQFKEIYSHIIQLKQNLNTYIDEKWMPKAEMLGQTGRLNKSKFYTKKNLSEDKDQINTLEVTNGRLNNWASTLVTIAAPQVKIGNNMVAKDFVSMTAATFSNMVKIQYDPTKDVHFLIKVVDEQPIALNGDDDCIGGIEGFCFRVKLQVGLDNPDLDSCVIEAYISFHHLDNGKRTFFEARNHGLKAHKSTCTQGVNTTDYENFLRTSVHLGTQYITQAFQVLNDKYLYLNTKYYCENYTITTNKKQFSIDCQNKSN